jgi:hypothetical protein
VGVEITTVGVVWAVHWVPSHQRWVARSLRSGYHPGATAAEAGVGADTDTDPNAVADTGCSKAAAAGVVD